MKTIVFIYIALLVASVTGYVMNLCKLATMIVHAAPVDALLLGRAVGVVAAPLGVVLGYF